MNPLELQLTFDREFDAMLDVFVLVSQFAKARQMPNKLLKQEFELSEQYLTAKSRYETSLERFAIVSTHYDITQTRKAVVARMQGIGQREVFIQNSGLSAQNYDMRFKSTREYFDKGAMAIVPGGTVRMENLDLTQRNILRIYDRVIKKVAWLESNPDVGPWMKQMKMGEAIDSLAKHADQEAVMNKLDSMMKRIDNMIGKDVSTLNELDGIISRQSGTLMKVDRQLRSVQAQQARMPETIRTAKRKATFVMMRTFMRGFQ